MIDLQHRMSDLERESPVSSLSPPLMSLVETTSAVAPVSDSIIIEGPGVTVPLVYVPEDIYRSTSFVVPRAQSLLKIHQC